MSLEAIDIHEGWLYKLTWYPLTRSWKRRYFVLHHKELCYYRNPDDQKAVGVVDLKHYHGVRVYETKRAPLAFRIESACRHHIMSYVLYADTPEETRTWMSLIEKHIKKQLGEHHCTPADPMIPGMNENDSVLDKWLDRLNLLDKEEYATSSGSSPSAQEVSQASSSKSLSLSTSLPPISTFSSSTEKLDSNDSTTGKSSSNSSTGKLASAFVLSAHNSLNRRNTPSERKRTSLPPITLSRSSINSSSPPPSMYKLSTREEDFSSTEDLFNFEQDHASIYNNTSLNGNRKDEISLEETIMSPYPVTPLPPPLRSDDRRKRTVSYSQKVQSQHD